MARPHSAIDQWLCRSPGIAPDRLHNYYKILRDIRRESMTPLERRALLSMWKSRTKPAAARIKMKQG